MKNLVVVISAFVLSISFGYSQQDIKLPGRSMERGSSLSKALESRQSIRSFETEKLSEQDLSDLLWAAKGVNRDDGKLTAPTAQNSQDVDVYVCTEEGVYLYDATNHALSLIISEDITELIDAGKRTAAPVYLLIVSDISRYRSYTPQGENNHRLRDMGALDAGIVSQNISLFCAANGMGTVPKAGMAHDAIKEKLKLKDAQTAWLNHPVGYPSKNN